MGSESLPAMNAEQFYVSVSRGRESAKVYSDLACDQLRDAIIRTDARKSATELIQPKPVRPRRKPKDNVLKFLAKARTVAKALRERAANAIERKHKEREGYAR